MSYCIPVVLMRDEACSTSPLHDALAQSSDIVLVGQVSHSSQLVPCVQSAQAELAILELQRISMAIIWQLAQLHLYVPNVQSLVCLSEPDTTELWGLLAAGVTGYLHIDDVPDGLYDAIAGVQRRGIWWSPTLVPLLQTWGGTQTGPHTLFPSAYEVAIVTRVAQGQTNRQIANALEVSERTIHFHLGQLYRRWGVQNRTQAALFAMAHGWIDENLSERQWGE